MVVVVLVGGAGGSLVILGPPHKAVHVDASNAGISKQQGRRSLSVASIKKKKGKGNHAGLKVRAL